MNKKNKNLNFKVNSKNNVHLQPHKREKLKIKLMEK